ncbi:hypothetical protein [Ramlibacter algicola]|uniref:Uncharacterized protein n=1 Tax=Ramlibacter algicola TaxID=2795217 RepID=A0A934USF6_9BURK|nr:hypothetical protein [Ramlibacter algicola]MBK0393487.1 hypothetical protein [Ramlibacter algicola]
MEPTLFVIYDRFRLHGGQRRTRGEDVAAFLKWLGSSGAWIRSLQYELPVVQEPAVRPELRHWCALAGGLALILSRATAQDIESSLRTTRAVYRQLRKCLQAGEAPRVASRLLSLLADEIDAVADPITKAACRRCMRKPKAQSPSEAALARATESTGGGGIDRHRGQDFEDVETQLSLDVFSKRSHALRRTVAGARRPTDT